PSRVARGIQQALRSRQAQERDWAGRNLRVRIGLNSGLVVVGRIGNKRGDFTAVGDTTNLAARLQQEAEPDTILASEAVVRPIPAYAHAEPGGSPAAEGRPPPGPRQGGRRWARSPPGAPASRWSPTASSNSSRGGGRPSPGP